jgi:hypothetical protein
MDDVVVPSYYIVSAKLPSEEAWSVIHALSITPCECAIISDILDARLALELSPNVRIAATDKDALGLAVLMSEEMQRPVLVIGEADFLDAVMPDGGRHPVCTSN